MLASRAHSEDERRAASAIIINASVWRLVIIAEPLVWRNTSAHVQNLAQKRLVIDPIVQRKSRRRTERQQRRPQWPPTWRSPRRPSGRASADSSETLSRERQLEKLSAAPLRASLILTCKLSSFELEIAAAAAAAGRLRSAPIDQLPGPTRPLGWEFRPASDNSNWRPSRYSLKGERANYDIKQISPLTNEKPLPFNLAPLRASGRPIGRPAGPPTHAPRP